MSIQIGGHIDGTSCVPIPEPILPVETGVPQELQVDRVFKLIGNRPSYYGYNDDLTIQPHMIELVDCKDGYFRLRRKDVT